MGGDTFKKRGLDIPPATEKRVSTVVSLPEAGYYKIGPKVCTVGCSNGGFTIIDRGGEGQGGDYGFNMGGTYAVDASDHGRRQWVRVLPYAVEGGKPLQLQVSYLEGASADDLLVRDAEREAGLGVGAVEQMRAGISLQTQAASGAAAANSEVSLEEDGFARGGWMRGV